jgi:hypothetical protein
MPERGRNIEMATMTCWSLDAFKCGLAVENFAPDEKLSDMDPATSQTVTREELGFV